MSGCRIARYRLKSGGAPIEVMDTPQRTHFHGAIENAAKSIDEDTHAIGFFVLYKDGEVDCGVSYDGGFTPSQLKGACEHMKDCLMDDVWGADEYE